MRKQELLLSKGKFMGLYYGQCVAKQKESTGNWIVGMQLDYSDVKLELKKLENLTDEDASKIPRVDYVTDEPWNAKRFLQDIEIFGFLTSEESDYLRSIGYAITWMTFTVEQQVELKWITLI